MTDIEISTDKARLDSDYIHGFLKASYWAEGIPKEMVEKSIKHSFCFGVYKNKKQIGFARVITDYTTFAYLADVFIDPQEQKKGYGEKLITAVLKHEKLKRLRRWHLITRDAQNFYQRLEFSLVANPEGHMEKYKKPEYKTADRLRISR